MPKDETHTNATLNHFGVDLTPALETIGVPAAVIDREGRIRWLNSGAVELFGNRVGDSFTRVVAPEDVHVARTHFAKKLIGEASLTEYSLTVLGSDGSRVHVRISSVPLRRNGEIIGTFGLACRVRPQRNGEAAGPVKGAPELTARQHEALALLADGLGTEEIASRLGVAEETARNHIRGLLRQLDAHSRLEAVVRAYRLGLLQLRRDD